MRTRIDHEKIEKQILAPYAVQSGESRGRQHPEEEHLYRTAFQRDRDRIIHSRAFRRLEYKTQVFVNHEGDHYRNRLTHTLEVAQIARTISRALGLNEDLAEAISLAHDLGHTPFGHSGQDVMAELMKPYGGFEHNKQSFRIVTFLEKSLPHCQGLNLTYEVLEGIAKHSTDYDMPDGDLFIRSGYPSLEAQICNYADEIAYNNHDIDDGLRSGLLQLKELKNIEIWENHFVEVEKLIPQQSEDKKIRFTIKKVLNFLATDLMENTAQNIVQKNITTASEVAQNGKGVVSFSEKARVLNAELKKFLYQKLYKHYRVERMAAKAERVITSLFQAYEHNTRILPPEFLENYQNEDLHRIICDYIAGMTDRFALEEYSKLFDPFAKV